MQTKDNGSSDHQIALLARSAHRKEAELQWMSQMGHIRYVRGSMLIILAATLVVTTLLAVNEHWYWSLGCIVGGVILLIAAYTLMVREEKRNTRRYPRVEVDWLVRLQAGERIAVCRTVAASRGGMHLEAFETLKLSVGLPVVVFVDSLQDVKAIQATVVWCKAMETGLKFTTPAEALSESLKDLLPAS